MFKIKLKIESFVKPLLSLIVYICIEPLLYHNRKCTDFSGLNMSIEGVFKLSAYADDITLFINNYIVLLAL